MFYKNILGVLEESGYLVVVGSVVKFCFIWSWIFFCVIIRKVNGIRKVRFRVGEIV